MENLRPVRTISAEEENFRVVNMQHKYLPDLPTMSVIKRDPVEPEPVGTYVIQVFRISGYDQDSDGSLMARMENVDNEGNTTGWCVDKISLSWNDTLVVDHPALLWEA